MPACHSAGISERRHGIRHIYFWLVPKVYGNFIYLSKVLKMRWC